MQQAAEENKIEIIYYSFLKKNKVPEECFKGCTKLRKIALPPSLDSIGNYAFKGCSSLSHIVIPSSVTIIGDNAFFNCTSLVQIKNSFFS